MEITAKEIVAAALKLPEKARAAIVERLLESLSPDAPEVEDDFWGAELDRRLADFQESEEGAVSWEEIKRRG